MRYKGITILDQEVDLLSDEPNADSMIGGDTILDIDRAYQLSGGVHRIAELTSDGSWVHGAVPA